MLVEKAIGYLVDIDREAFGFRVHLSQWSSSSVGNCCYSDLVIVGSRLKTLVYELGTQKNCKKRELVAI